MTNGKNTSGKRKRQVPKAGLPFRLSPVALGLCCLVVVMAVTTGKVHSQQDGNGNQHDMSGIPPINPLANRHPDANRLLEDAMRAKDNQKRLQQLNVQRQKQMTEDTARLLTLASELKSEMRQPGKDALSVVELRKAELIEKLARNVREKMKATIGPD